MSSASRALAFAVGALRTEGRFIELDAAETLATFMVDGMPDAALFTQTIHPLLADLARKGGELRAFGEMVALLWTEGNKPAAIRLEELWNEAAAANRFTLMCAYPLSAFDLDADGVPFEKVCTCHSRVIPGESYAHASPAMETGKPTLREQIAAALRGPSPLLS